MPKFQRRHYEAIADVIADVRGQQLPLFELASLNQIAQRMVVTFEDDNPRFNRDRFLSACGIFPATTAPR